MRLRLLVSLGLSLVLVAGCKLTVPTKGATRTPQAAATRMLPLSEPPREIAKSGELTSLIGKVKLISDKGFGIVSNNSGSILSNNGGNLVTDNGSGLVTDNGSGLRSKYRLQAAAVPESLLAEAQIEVLDARGRVLVGADGKALGTTTDAKGAYRLAATLPKENLILRVRLFNGGQLLALLPLAQGASALPAELAIDTASSLSASYVLSRFVEQRQEVLDRLPGAESEGLHADMEGARALLPPGMPSYLPADMVAAAEGLRSKDARLDERLERIKAILLAGQANLGEGLQATSVSLSGTIGVTGDGAGALFIAELAARIRRVAPDGTMQLFHGPQHSAGNTAKLASPTAVVYAADGSLIVADGLGNAIRRIAPDGSTKTLAGTGEARLGELGGPATETAIWGPTGLALAKDGTLYFGEAPNEGKISGRILKLAPGGTIEAIAPPTTLWERALLSGMAVADDGTLTVLNTDRSSRSLQRRSPDGTWTVVAADLPVGRDARIALAADGITLVSMDLGHQVERISPEGQRTVIVGTGVPGLDEAATRANGTPLNTPAGLWLDAAGALYVADHGNGLVRKIENWQSADATIRTVAGTGAAGQTGDALGIALNAPGGLAIDGQGRLVVAETGGNTIKRLEGDRLVLLAGGAKGFGGDNGPALAAQFMSPGGVACFGDNIYVLDGGNERVRRIDAAGIVTTVAGIGLVGSGKRGARIPALEAAMNRPIAIAIGPGGMPYWTESALHQVQRLTPDGFVEVVAGDVKGESGLAGGDGPAIGNKLQVPSGLAFDSSGTLYISDTGNMRICKVTGLGAGEVPQMTTIAGVGLAETISRLTSGTALPDGAMATDSPLLGPGALCFDAQGGLYIAEIGTTRLGLLAGATEGPTAMLVAQLPEAPARLRKLGADGRLTVVAGPGSALLKDASGEDALDTPVSLVIDPQGRLIISDAGRNQLKVLPKGSY